MAAANRWLEATWPMVRTFLPGPPGEVVEIGCGPLGGFVPMLRSSGYDAVAPGLERYVAAAIHANADRHGR